MSGFAAAAAVGLAPTLAILVTYILARRDSREAASAVAKKVDDVASKASVVAEKVDKVAAVADSTSHATTEKLEEIHVLVNSRLTEALKRIDDLEKSLGIPAEAPAPPPRRL